MKAQEMHRLAYSVSKFFKENNKGKLAEKETILAYLVKLEQLMGLSTDLPSEASIKQIQSAEKEAQAIEKESN